MMPYLTAPETIAVLINRNMYMLDIVMKIAISIIVLLFLFNAIGACLSFKTFGEYGWSIYVIQGADIAKREIMRRYHLFLVLLKFNLYFTIGILVQVGASIYFYEKMNVFEHDGNSDDIARNSLNGVNVTLWIGAGFIVVIGVIYYFVGFYGIRNGNYTYIAIFFAMILANMGCISYLLYEAQNGSQKFGITKIWLSLFVVIQLLINLASFVSAVFCMMDFKKGLKALVKSMPNPGKPIKVERFIID